MGGLKGVISGLIGSGQNLPTVNIQALLDTINNAGANQRQMINNLPPEIQNNLAAYIQQMGAGADKYQSATQALSQGLQDKAGAIYGPNTEAANAAKLASKNDVYSAVPGTQNAIRNALAATGGLGRGNAATSLAQPYVQAAQQYGQQANAINADQAKMGQGAALQALNTATSMDANMFTQLFGMSKEQAQQILQTGNQALRDQLAQLITQSTNQTNQTLGAQGVAVNNGYQNAVTRGAQQNAIWSGLANMGVDAAANMAMPGSSALMSGAPSADYNENIASF